MPELTRDPIADYLEARGLAHTLRDGVHVVPYGDPGAPEGTPPKAILLLWSGDMAAGGVMVELHTAPVVSSEQMIEALRRCNDWNRRSRATKARLDGAEGAEGRVVIEAWMPSAGDVTDEALHVFLDGAIADMLASWPEQETAVRAGTPTG